jgi:hypothetical protein
LYIKYADQLLREIPGPHLEVMETWPKWDQSKSPPPPGGQYLNPLYVPEAPKLILPPAVPVVEEIGEGPTFMEQPSQEPTTERESLLLPAPRNKQPLLLEGTEVHIVEPSVHIPITEESLVPDISGEGIAHKASSPSVVGSLMIEAAPEDPELVQLETMPPVIAAPIDHISKVEEASSLDDFGAIKGIRPDTLATAEVHANSAVESPAAIRKHLAVMAGNSFPEGANRRNWNGCRWCPWSWCYGSQIFQPLALQQETQSAPRNSST